VVLIMGIEVKMTGVSGSFDMNAGNLVCISSPKYYCVELCLSASMNIPIANIKLHEGNRLSDAKDVFDNAELLGKEVVNRWNSHSALKNGALAFNDAINYALDDLDKDDSKVFLEMWREGDWDSISKDFSTFNLGAINNL
jgi:hypothetical protein